MKRPNCPKCGQQMWLNGSRSSSGRVRWICRHGGQFCYTSTFAGGTEAIARNGKKLKTPVFKRMLNRKGSRFIVTTAQNATPVHKGFFDSLLRCAKHLNAELIVIPIRYKNPTSRWSASQANAEEWAPEVQPYLCNTRIRLNRNLVVLGDVKTQPTASSPLTGFEAITHGESGILGHTKLQLRTVPTPQSAVPKILTTTGAVTVANYTDSKAGKLGEFHHTLGAAMVELEGGRFHLRQLNADKDGSFYDLTTHYAPRKVTEGVAVAALVMGDTHVDFIDPLVERATFARGGMVDALKPKVLVWGDVLDAFSANPHHAGNPFAAIAKRKARADDVRAEVRRAIEFVAQRTPPTSQSILLASNHSDFLRRWIFNTDWRADPVNAEFYLATALAMVQSTRLTPKGTEYLDPFAHYVRQANAPRVRVLDADESFVAAGIELGMHGDRGPNGARGSIKNLRRLGVKTIIGHSHSPGIDEGCYQVGTSTRLRLEYNLGPSSWLNAHAVVHMNGKRQLVMIIDGAWRLEYK